MFPDYGNLAPSGKKYACQNRALSRQILGLGGQAGAYKCMSIKYHNECNAFFLGYCNAFTYCWMGFVRSLMKSYLVSFGEKNEVRKV